jgi:crotonobetainyl-CoA:carnitine CoA-transferase CaiB-like acyl-CoA transferase
MTGALDGLRVVEVGDFVSAPYCTKLLADLGADVVKVEPPEGDRARRYGPFRDDQPDEEASGLFVYLNTNKRSVQLDLATEDGRTALDGLLTSADVLVENVEPDVVAAWGLDYESLHAAHPSLIVTSVSIFGRQGPLSHYRGHSLQASAGSLFAARVGEPGRTPLSKPLNDHEFVGGIHAAAGTMAALMARDRMGIAQHVDVGIQDALTVATSGMILPMVLQGGAMMAQRSGHRVTLYYPWTVLPVADGYMEFITMQDRHWRSFIEEIGSPEWADDPRFADMWERAQFADELDELVLAGVRHRTKADLWQKFRERKISFQPVQTIDELVEAPHMQERGYFIEVQDGREETMTVPGAPYQLAATPWAIRRRAPRLGEHTAEVLAESHPPPTLPARSDAANGNGASGEGGPLAGLRVIDLGQVWAGPLLGQYLADFGAQVIKVASAEREAMQSLRNQTFDPDAAVSYDGLARNRLSMSLDLTTEGGREILDRLVATSDVIFDNFSPRAMRQLGLEPERLHAINPRIVQASLSAAGQQGPWSDLLTYGPALTALYGVKSLLGYPGETKIQEDVADMDPTAATYAFVAILAALRAREQSGEGQFIDMAQGEAGAAALAEAVLEYKLNGRVMGPMGNRHRTMAPHGIYRAAGEDAWISIAVDSDETWRALCGVLGFEELASDERFASMEDRLQRVDELDALIEPRTVNRDANELTQKLQALGVASYPVVDALGALADPQLAARRELVRIAMPGIAPSELFTANPWRMSETPSTIHTPAKPVGEDNELVLREVLGMSDEEIERVTAPQSTEVS